MILVILLGFEVWIAPGPLGLAKRVIREKIGNFLNFSIFWRKFGFDLEYCTIGTQTCTVILTCAKTHENPWFIGCRGNLKAFWGPHSEKIRPPEKFRKTGWKGRTFRDFRFFGPKHDFSPTVHAQKIWHGGFGCISGENGRKWAKMVHFGKISARMWAKANRMIYYARLGVGSMLY